MPLNASPRLKYRSRNTCALTSKGCDEMIHLTPAPNGTDCRENITDHGVTTSLSRRLDQKPVITPRSASAHAAAARGSQLFTTLSFVTRPENLLNWCPFK